MVPRNEECRSCALPEWCLFLDVDGTLVEIADTPSSVMVDPSLNTLLSGVSQRLNGALALVSGRSIATIDQLFAPLKLPAAGQHGAERRDASGVFWTADSGPGECLDGARASLRAFVESHPGTLFEDKAAPSPFTIGSPRVRGGRLPRGRRGLGPARSAL